ncbi:calcyphosin-like protein [Octopus sinensis]|uniref:Calcyphosin-like protein n=1 Tax=Octopus sinensis TaxID=2607531 RepID=A0A6P7U9Q9_9MOLL|nr:calcyphosin-like protein [Octopus sinensis]XP_029658098.1 calcyphosin-like protein [Octopus sinensis]XP_036356241.1 calcyphosin-like protein [Octopus sinensis]
MEERAQKLIEFLRNECIKRGCTSGIKGLGLIFRSMDIDFSKRLCFDELKLGIQRYGIEISDSDLLILFNAIDIDNNKTIDFGEFMHKLRPPLTGIRLAVVKEAFQNLDVNNDTVIAVDDLKVFFANNAMEHPKYRSGEWTEEETLRNFLDGLDTPGCCDGKVTEEEFINYYAGVSATVEDSSYFDLMMRSTYKLPAKSTC